jgi:hypothetical protein
MLLRRTAIAGGELSSMLLRLNHHHHPTRIIARNTPVPLVSLKTSPAASYRRSTVVPSFGLTDRWDRANLRVLRVRDCCSGFLFILFLEIDTNFGKSYKFIEKLEKCK